MKAISIKQPWAWLIVNADRYPDPKRLENRDWTTKLRGPILIHASQGFDKQGYESVIAARPDLEFLMPAPNQFERGGIVGQAEIVDVVSASDSAWFVGKHAFVLERGMKRPFVPMKGMLSLFEVDAEPLPYVQDTTPPIGAGDLEQMAKAYPESKFLKGSGVLKLLGAIRNLECQIRELKDKPPATYATPVSVMDAAVALLSHRNGELPLRGWLHDNDQSRQAIDTLAKAVAAFGTQGLVMACLEQMGQITTKDEDQPAQFYPYALLLGFNTEAEIRKAIADGAVKFDFKE